MFRIFKALKLLRILQDHLYQTAMSNDEGVVISSNISKTMNDICKMLVLHSDVTIRTDVAIHKSRETLTFTGNKG